MIIPKQKEYVYIGILSLLTYLLQSLAWPLFLGRDAWNYLYYFLDMSSKNPVYYYIMARRTPVAPLLFGTTLSIGGVILTEVLLASFYVISILGIFTIGKYFSPKIGLILALLINFYPAYGQRFHAIETESPSAVFLIILGVLLFGTLHQPKSWKFALMGLVVVILTLTRPDHLVFVGLVASPFLIASTKWKEKLGNILIFLAVVVPVLLLWSTYNYLRYDDFTISRGGDAHIPFQRAFEFSHTVRIENGPASAELVKLVETDLLTKEPYKTYGIDSQIFFSSATERMYYDLPGLIDLHYGWDTDYELLKQAGIEAVRADPIPFLWSYTKSAGVMLLFNSIQPAVTRNTGKDDSPQLDARGLPIPSEGDLIPRSYYPLGYTSPTAQSLPDPNSLDLIILDPTMRQKTTEMEAKLDTFRDSIPNRDGSEWMAMVLNRMTSIYPPAFFWLLVGCLGMIVNPSKEKLALSGFIGFSMIVILYPILGINPVPIMRIKFDPFFILCGLVGGEELIKQAQQKFSLIKRQG